MRFDNQNEINQAKQEDLATQTEINIFGPDINDVNILKECKVNERLYIQHTQISDLPLGNATKLKYVYIWQCKKLQNLNGLEHCPEMVEIIIRWLDINSIATIGKLNKLKRMTIDNCNHITDYDTFEGCTSLDYIWIYQSNISDISPITYLQDLKTLYLKENLPLPEQYRKYVDNNHAEVQKFLEQYRQTQQYKDYQSNK